MKRSVVIASIAAAFVLVVIYGSVFYSFEEARKNSDRNALAKLEQGIALFNERRYEESRDVLQSIPPLLSDDWHLPYYTASSLLMLRNYEEAASKYEEALSISPSETAILFALGVNYYKLGKLDLSKAYFAAVLEIDPGNDEARGLMDIMADLERQQPGNDGLESQPPES